MPTTTDIAVNVRHTYKGDVPTIIERASVTFNDDGSIVIRNRTGVDCRLDRDAATALAILLKQALLVPTKEASFGNPCQSI